MTSAGGTVAPLLSRLSPGLSQLFTLAVLRQAWPWETECTEAWDFSRAHSKLPASGLSCQAETTNGGPSDQATSRGTESFWPPQSLKQLESRTPRFPSTSRLPVFPWQWAYFLHNEAHPPQSPPSPIAPYSAHLSTCLASVVTGGIGRLLKPRERRTNGGTAGRGKGRKDFGAPKTSPRRH